MAAQEFTEIPGEEWRTIEEFPTYQVSNFGRVRKVQVDKWHRPRLRKVIYNPVTEILASAPV